MGFAEIQSRRAWQRSAGTLVMQRQQMSHRVTRPVERISGQRSSLWRPRPVRSLVEDEVNRMDSQLRRMVVEPLMICGRELPAATVASFPERSGFASGWPCSASAFQDAAQDLAVQACP